jgi:MinD-like ATPase involved in chromosome partitioning or flagellar assembly
MPHIVSIHSYRGGTGKSNLAANVAWLAARAGRRVAVLDTDLQSPGVHMVFGLQKERIAFTLTDHLFGRCELEEAAYDITREQEAGPGALYLLPSKMTVEAIMRILDGGYDVGKLNQHFGHLLRALQLDLLLLDTHPGLNRETTMTTAICDALLLVLRPDTQDYHGTAVLLEVANHLLVPRTWMLVNKIPSAIDHESVREKVRAAFGHEVIGTLGLVEDIALLGSRGLFARVLPGLELTAELTRVTDRLLAGLPAARPR